MRHLLFLFLILTFPAWASPPVPGKKSEALNFDQKLQTEKHDKKALEKQAKAQAKNLKETQEALVKIAADIQKNEQRLNALNTRIQDLENNKDVLEQSLDKDKAGISQMILALERIRRRPPEAMIVSPETPYKTAQSAMLLQNILPRLEQKTQKLKTELQKLAGISEELDGQKTALRKEAEVLDKRQATLSRLLDKRKTLYASTQDDLKTRERRIRKISTQAKNLQDLVHKLDQERTRAQNKRLKQQAMLTRPTAVGASLKDVRPGQPRLPITGIIKTGYNQPDNFGAPSKGLDIEGRGGALAVAPMGGIVKFTGPFKNYGQIVILEHRDGYHSLVAGLEKIDTVVGQKLNAGEPLGRLHHARSGRKPVLYYELRYKGKPVNPSRKFSAL